MRINFLRCAGVLIALLLASVTQAALVTYQLNNFNFNDGGSASGTFSFDTVSDAYSSTNITTSAGTIISPGFSYSDSNIFSGASDISAVWTTTDGVPGPTDYSLAINFSSSFEGGGRS